VATQNIIFSEVSKSSPKSHAGRPNVLFSDAFEKKKTAQNPNISCIELNRRTCLRSTFNFKRSVKTAYTVFQNVKPVQMYSEEEALA